MLQSLQLMVHVEHRGFSVDHERIDAALASLDLDQRLETLRNTEKLGDFFEKVTEMSVQICLTNPSLLSPDINTESGVTDSNLLFFPCPEPAEGSGRTNATATINPVSSSTVSSAHSMMPSSSARCVCLVLCDMSA